MTQSNLNGSPTVTITSWDSTGTVGETCDSTDVALVIGGTCELMETIGETCNLDAACEASTCDLTVLSMLTLFMTGVVTTMVFMTGVVTTVATVGCSVGCALGLASNHKQRQSHSFQNYFLHVYEPFTSSRIVCF